MPRGIKKENLPTKTCVVCERPFNWRKKWERCWDEVTTCSKSCNRKRREKARTSKVEPAGSAVSESEASYSSDIGKDSLFAMIRTEIRLDQEEVVGVEDASDASSSKANSDDGGDECGANSEGETSVDNLQDPKEKAKAERKAAKRAKKAARRAQREGRGDPSAGQKKCDMCGKSVILLIRCTYDASGEWKMVCGKCWNIASGGVIDGDAQHPHYRYGGLWKNRRAR